MVEYPFLLKELMAYLEDIKAIDIVVIDVSKQTSVTDYMVICSGTSSRHVKAIAESMLERMKKAGIPSLGQHGLDNGEWALIDFGDAVLHVMQPNNRIFYDLEGLWQAHTDHA